MAKRFTDTEKWKKPFIRGLQGPYKLLWLYICDDCDHAGIWQVDIDVAQIRIGEKIDINEAIKIFDEKIIIFDKGNKWFIPSFIEFQYPSGLNPDNRAHNSIIILLEKYKLLDKQNKPLTRPLQGCKDMDMDMVKDKDKVKEPKNIEISFLGNEIIEYWDLWKDYKSKQFKFKYKTVQSEQAAFDDLVRLSEKNCKNAIEIIKQSMANGWKGLFELKISQNKTLSPRIDNKYQREIEAARNTFKPILNNDNNF
jgi:hypothetical protein